MSHPSRDDLTLLCDPSLPMPPTMPDWKYPRKIKSLNGYGTPFFMAPINTRVVRRSQSLFGKESLGFCYEEGLLIRESLPVKSSFVSELLDSCNCELNLNPEEILEIVRPLNS